MIEQPQTKFCPGCTKTQDRSEFSKSSSRLDGLQGYCKECRARRDKENKERISERRKRKYRENPEPHRERMRGYYRENKDMWVKNGRAYHLRVKYGLTQGEYDLMVESQEGRCAVCGEKSDKLRVDHNHDSGEVRALLCHACNVAIGFLEEDPPRIRRAAAYIHLHQLGHPTPTAVLRNLRRRETY